MAKRFKRKAKVGVMVRYWVDGQLSYGIIASIPNGEFFNSYYRIRECGTQTVRFFTESQFTIHKA